MRRRSFSAPVPEPKAIDPISGFEVPISNLRRQWDGEMVDYRFMDKRNPQDLIRVRPERIALPYARPEPPERYVALNLLTEASDLLMAEHGPALMEEGIVVRAEDL